MIVRYTLIVLALLCAGYHVEAQPHLERTTDNFHELVAEIEADRKAGRVSDREYKLFKRWEIAVTPYVGPDGVIPNYTARNWEALQRYLRRQGQQPDPQQRATHGEWEPVTPTQFTPNRPANGRLNCVVVHPTNSDIIYVGAAVGGLWRSADGGSTWVNQTDGMINLGVSDVVIHPTSPNIMYMLTGDGDGRNAPSMGVFKSTNSGWDWKPTDLYWDRDETRYGYKMIMDPNDPDYMYVASTTGLYHTDDGWESYAIHSIGSLRDIEFKPGSSDTFYIAGLSNVWKGWIDGSSSFLDVDSDLLNNNNNGLTDTTWQRAAVAVTPDDPSRVYALFGRNSPQHKGTYELYVSFDNAQNFSLQSWDSTGVASAQCTYNMTLEVEPGSPNKLFLGTVALWKSTNSGASFAKVANGSGLPSIHADVHDLFYDGITLYTATDGGLSKSSNSGVSYTNLSDGLDIMQFYDIDVLGVNLIGGTQDNSTNEWNLGDAVANWEIGGDGFECIYDPTEGVTYGCTQNNRYRRTGGGGWDSITPQTHKSMWDASWVMHPTDYDTLYSAYKDLAISYDQGSSWTLVDPGFTADKTIRAIAQGINNPNVMWLSDRKAIRFTNNLHAATPTWNDFTFNLTSMPNFGGLAVDPDSAGVAWVTVRGYSDGNKVFKHTNFGTWTNISGSLPNVPIYCIAYEPGSDDGLYIGTDLGIFYRNNNMSDWIWFSNGFPKTRVEDIKVTGSYVYAGTYGRSLWRSPRYTTCPLAISLTPSNDPSPAHTTGVQVYSASSAVISTRVITGGIGTNVTYQGGNYVRLDPGFHAEINNEFLAKVDGCPE